jgi:hypothetical protein
MPDRFTAPDGSVDRVANTCSFHAFRLADARGEAYVASFTG